MKRSPALPLRRLSIACIALCSLLAIRPAAAQATTKATEAMDAYNSAFLVQSGGQTYYTAHYQQGLSDVQWGWGQDLDLYVLEDRYEHTRSQSDLNLVNAVLNSMLTSPTWDSAKHGYLTGDFEPNADGWNDDIGWTNAAYTLGYMYTGNQAYLTEAEKGWNFVMDGRPGDPKGSGYDPTYGGIHETNDGKGKCQLSNSSYVYTGVWLYQITGDVKYLNGAENVYAWERKTIVNTSGSPISTPQGNWQPWQVIGCTVDSKGTINNYASDNVYDNGGVIYAATELYRVTGNQQYYSDALNIIKHVHGEYNPTATPPVPLAANNPWCTTSDDGGLQPQNYVFTRGLSNFLTYTAGWSSSPYAPWLQANAQDAWNDADSLGLTWNKWTTVVPDTAHLRSMDESSAAAIWQHLPPPAMSLAGTYEIQNVNSGLALNVQGASTANSAPVIQSPFTSGQKNALWTFVPTSGGYYQIKNVNSGLVLNVAGGVGGGSGYAKALIVQFTAQSMIPGNDQWMPVQNSDGTFSFYNLLSKQALNVAGSSTASGTQLDQYFQNSSAAQKFSLIQPSLNLSGTWEIQNTNSGLAINVSRSSVSNNGIIDQYAFSSGNNAMKWTFVPASPGYYQIKNVNSGLDIAVQNTSTTMGAPLIQFTFGSTYNDQWRPVVNSDGTYSFYNANSSQAIDVPKGATTSGLQLDQWGENGTSAQSFKLITQ